MSFLGIQDRPNPLGRWPNWRYMLLVVPITILLGINTVQGIRELDVSRRQAITIGHITEVDLQNHNSCYFHFLMGDIWYHGGDSCGSIPPSPGDEVTIYYDSANPSTSALEPFETRGHRDESFGLIVTINISMALAILASKLWIRRHKAPQ